MQRKILTPRNLKFLELNTLDSSVLEPYNEGIKSYGEKARNTLNIFKDINGELAGSNCFAPIELRKYFTKEKLATMADLGRATEINPIFLNGFYFDTGLVLRTKKDSFAQNDLLAKNLAQQLKRRNITLATPKVIYFDALDIKEDINSHYGLVYILNETAKLEENIIDAPGLVKNFIFKTMNEKGIPIEDEQGNKTCCTRKDGLSRFYLFRCSVVDSGIRVLVCSNDDYRVVVKNVS